MLRPVSMLPALAAVLTLAGGTSVALVAQAAPATAAAPQASPREPLGVTIDTMPSELPRRGPVRVTGSVTNRDDSTWQAIKVYAFMSSGPITTTTGLAEAARTPVQDEVGERVIDPEEPDTEETIDELEPGESAQFSVTVPHHDLTIDGAGVYWFGIHALGEGPEGRLDGADGRARTFLPYVPPTRLTVDTSVMVPVRRLVTHAPDGSIADLDRWTADLSAGGSLRALVDLGVSSGSRPITWVVDPAVVDAVRRIAAGNPGRRLGPTVVDGDQPADGGEDGNGSGDDKPGDGASSQGGDPSTSPDGSGGPGGDASEQPELTPAQQEAADAATTWLERLHVGLTDSEVLSLPYGDVDVAAAADHDPATYRSARKRAGGRLAPWDLPTSPVVMSPTGYLDTAGIRLAERRATVIVTDRMFGARAPTLARTAGHEVIVSSSGAASGGPGPDDRLAPIAVRQRIVSEAALRLLTPGRKPLVVALPRTWRPQAAPGFFEGLDLPWLHLTGVRSVRSRAGHPVDAGRLRYPESQSRLELDPATFAATDALTRAGETLQNLLTQNDAVAGEVHDEAYADLSYSSRLRPRATRASADQSRAWIESKLRSVHIDAPRAVILSSGSGRFAATVTNDLDEPVTVRIKAVAEPPLKVSVRSETVDLGPQARATVLLNAASSAVGIRDVTLLLTDLDGAPLGSSDDLPIRSNRVSTVIWLIVGTGVALLFLAIVVRLVRRVRASRRRPAGDPA